MTQIKTKTSTVSSKSLDTNTVLYRGNYTLCPICHNVKYKKQWYSADSKVALLVNNKKAHPSVQRCPACEMKIAGRYNAVVVMHDVPPKLHPRIESLIEQAGERAVRDDSQDRVLEVIENLDGYEVRLTTSRLAQIISKKLQSEFKVCEVVTHVSGPPDRRQKKATILRVSDYFK